MRLDQTAYAFFSANVFALTLVLAAPTLAESAASVWRATGGSNAGPPVLDDPGTPTASAITKEVATNGLPAKDDLLSRGWVDDECAGDRTCEAGVLLAYLVQPEGDLTKLDGPFSLHYGALSAVPPERSAAYPFPMLMVGTVTAHLGTVDGNVEAGSLNLFGTERWDAAFSYSDSWHVDVSGDFAASVTRTYERTRARRAAEEAEANARWAGKPVGDM